MKTTDIDSRARVAHDLATSVAGALREDLAQQERVTLVLSGGSTPRPFMQTLSKMELPWSRVDITLADERWVPTDHDDSNDRFVRTHMLINAAAEARFQPLVNDEATPEAGVEEVGQRLAALTWPASVVVLGMGGDGHTASLFPDSPELGDGLGSDALVVAAHAPSVAQPRISLTRHRLMQSRRRYLHFNGADKKAVLARAMAGSDQDELPIRAFLDAPLALYWAP
ncbi:6-phosphogluconolactonase [Kushneria marisflavi]|uniref:6-phosphogluconolactonase n=1 Tax=Kushneria marisflavi TaxID=157779 RepID=A0A240URV5_9GAMM|nr:6-phosphogluconolactonase [Kushneria marisflavi]ART63866.1 6-phosphogluconolactonase [Kushneria marisflavi]RKD85573.1 6-phosphogluconolactonase [Kushneria marisflavi]